MSACIGPGATASANALAEEFSVCGCRADLSKQNAFHPKSVETTLRDLLKTLAQKELNRVPILDSSGNRVIRIVSRSTVIAFLAKHVRLSKSLHGGL
jgi:hypothetical protein